jgi:CelD/BcsL family acetyltransferase involved in cellulose biosynthesis
LGWPFALHEGFNANGSATIMRKRCPNTFTHLDWIRAISAHIRGGELLRVPATGLPRLSTAICQRYWPISHAETWITALTYSGLPVSAIEPALPDAAALIDATESPIFFRDLPVDHPATELLLQAASQTKVITRWKRAALNLNCSFEDWMQNNFDQKRRKELNRLRARLSEQGKVESVSLQKNGDLVPFLKAFLKLEALSWKGQRGTAISDNPHTESALEAGLAAMHRIGRLKFWQINFDGEPIAALFALTDDGEVSLGKISHSHAFAKYSPGVLIILDATADLLADGSFVRADGNAIPDHPMINRIWRDRIECVDVLLAGPATPTPVFKLLAAWLGTKAAIQPSIKRLRARITGRKIS